MDALQKTTAGDISDHWRNGRYVGDDVILSDNLCTTTDFADCADVVVMDVPLHHPEECSPN